MVRVTAADPTADADLSRHFRVAPELAEALRARRPVVALETTLVTHGLPRPEGLAVAAELEGEVRAAGALPATIGLLEGRIVAGLTPAELERLAGEAAVTKVNLSNLGACLASGEPGSTTVAATLLAAHHLGIRVFATGGIGGVHRDSAASGDVSADLTALARFPVAVVCAGAKAVLDLPKTVEALETLGVPVLGWRTGSFPAFYRRESGLSLDRRFDALPDLARAVESHLGLGLGSGVLVANPIAPEHEMPAELYESGLARALADAMAAGVRGRNVTPFLLERLRQLTEGRSVFSNRALLRANARLAGQLAAALAPAA
ncbi:MAG TPA: pseudouridine-5'-phosphate glycosidase [Vicinamibacteria bacterium]|nr:pseudouridine-5'-phosphate glycosidase [Vicinamibacteria bacterium]